jgi:hypothetical protein
MRCLSLKQMPVVGSLRDPSGAPHEVHDHHDDQDHDEDSDDSHDL